MGSRFLTPFTTSMVEACPFLSTVDRTARPPSTCTIFCCGGLPSRTWPTSCIKMVPPSTVFTGRSFISSMVSAALLSLTTYWKLPILILPTGTIWFWLANAFCTSVADRPSRLHGLGSRSICTCAEFAAIGKGHRRARHRRQPRARKILRIVQDLLFRQRIGREGHLQHRHGGGIIVEDRMAAGCPPASGGWPSGRIEVTCAVARRISASGWKIDLDDADALHGLALGYAQCRSHWWTGCAHRAP